MILKILLLILLIASPCFAQDKMARMNVAIIGGGVPAGGVTCTGCNTSNDSAIWTTGYSYAGFANFADKLAYPFTLASTQCVTGVQWVMSDEGNTYGAICEIWNSSGTEPTSIVGAGYTSTVANLQDTPAVMQEFPFAATQTLPAGNYFVVCWGPEGAEGAPTFGKESDTGGALQYYGGGTWHTDAPWKEVLGVLGCDPS